MKSNAIKRRAKEDIKGILSIKWSAKKLADSYLNGDIFKLIPMFSLWSPNPGGVRVLPDGLEKRLSETTLKELTDNYDKGIILKICSALEFFDILEKGPPFDLIKHSIDKAEAVKYFKKQNQKMIKAANRMLEKTNFSGIEINYLTETQRNVIKDIKRFFEKQLELFPAFNNKRAVDHFVANLLGFRAQRGPDCFPLKEWKKEFLSQLFLQRPASGPKQIISNTLRIVIYQLLKKQGKPVKWRKILTAEIINDYYKKTLKWKDIDNALHGST